MATAEAPSSDERAKAFAAWLPEDAVFRAAIKRTGDHWYALAEEFDITGMGETPNAALREMFDLIEAYLRAFFEEGRPFDDALRPIPLKLKVGIRAQSALGSLVRGLNGRLPRERSYLLPQAC